MEMRVVSDTVGRSYAIPAHILADFEVARPVQAVASNGRGVSHDSANGEASVRAEATVLGGYALPAPNALKRQEADPGRVIETVLGGAPITLELGVLGELVRQRPTSMAARPKAGAAATLVDALGEPLLAKQHVTLRLGELAELVHALKQ